MSCQNNELKVTFKKNSKVFLLNITIDDIKDALTNKKVSISNKKLKRLTRKRIINLILLQKLANETLIPEYIPKEYEAFYFEKGTNNNNFSIDLDDLPKLFTDNPSIWDKKYFNLNQLMYNNDNINFDNQEEFLKREFIKYIIKSNIINSESILYFIALVCNLEMNKKDIDYRDILEAIDNNKNTRFWKRIYNRVSEFFSSFN